jgi:Spherulation-specific family 4
MVNSGQSQRLHGADPAPPLTETEQHNLVPAYFSPDFSHQHSRWQSLLDNAKSGSVIIINPNSGPGSARDVNYVRAIDECRAHGLKVIGYINTRKGSVPVRPVYPWMLGRRTKNVLEQIDAYRSWYPKLSGVFLDEMNLNAQDSAIERQGFFTHTTTVEQYHAAIKAEVRKRTQQIIVGNPRDVSESQGDWAFNAVDLLVVQESDESRYLSWTPPKWVYPGTDRSHAYRIAHLVYGVTDQREVTEISRARHAGYVYATDRAGGADELWNEVPRWWRTT